MITEICTSICQHTEAAYAIVAFAFGNEALEFWLGKTDKTKGGSKWELLINVFRAFRLKKTTKEGVDGSN